MVVITLLVSDWNFRSLHEATAAMAATDVSFDDQQKINAFSRLNAKLHDLQARITAKKAAAEDLEEAGNEVMLLDDETVPFVVGECMVHLPRDDVEERLQKRESGCWSKPPPWDPPPPPPPPPPNRLLTAVPSAWPLPGCESSSR